MMIVTWIALGILAGILAKAMNPRLRGGTILSTIVTGILGAFVGGTLAMLMFQGTFTLALSALSFSGILLAIAGTMIAVGLLHMIVKNPLG